MLHPTQSCPVLSTILHALGTDSALSRLGLPCRRPTARWHMQAGGPQARARPRPPSSAALTAQRAMHAGCKHTDARRSVQCVHRGIRRRAGVRKS